MSQIATLILATSIVQLANGFFNTFISLRVAAANMSLAGVILSAYFAGFTIGALCCGRLIARVGHIRAYAAFAGIVAASTVVMPLWAGTYSWTALRALVGFGCAGIFVTTESWLNAKAEPSARGRVFAIYLTGTFLALALGQLLIARADINDGGSFSKIVALFAIALVIVTLAKSDPPSPQPDTTVSAPLMLLRNARIAVIGVFISGIISSAFYALIPAWMAEQNIDLDRVSLFMLVAVLGGFFFQIPVGRLSDRYNRRILLLVLSLGLVLTIAAIVLNHRPLYALLTEAFLLGGFMSSLYPVCIAHASDCTPPDKIISVSSQLILISGVGSVIGPLAGEPLMRTGINNVFYLMAGTSLLLALIVGASLWLHRSPDHAGLTWVMTPQAGPLVHDIANAKR